MAECKWCYNEFCVNADCPLVADFCPVSDTPGVCKWEERSVTIDESTKGGDTNGKKEN